ncbi:TIGR02444 family protein [Shewanella baltica]|uniref:TIGR02444 family protein n=1 Tax=Shewanella baltica TaxID=62322 RepID=UPI00217E0A2F|nr:TIGR02444 family protein [Shewanella baltica]MCS6100755.1 TIGR02444 family protein [Shewanella baltica]MCS6183561.1 TIGR02444 family protein [Shewanella baltica]
MAVLTQFDSQLWQWCDMSYAQNKALCLELQNSCQVNVNLLLLAQYLDITQDVTGPQRYSTDQWQTLMSAVGEWDNKFLMPYRKLRKLAKPSLNEQEYQQMLDVELMMERKAQRTILFKIKELTPNGKTTNLVSYLSLFGLSDRDANEIGLIAP